MRIALTILGLVMSSCADSGQASAPDAATDAATCSYDQSEMGTCDAYYPNSIAYLCTQGPPAEKHCFELPGSEVQCCRDLPSGSD